MKNQKNILFLASWYPNRNRPTHGIFIKRHAEAVALFNKVFVLHVCSEKNLAKSYDAVLTRSNDLVEIIVYYKKAKYNPFLKFYRYIKASRIAIQHAFNEVNRFDFIHLHVIYPVGIIYLFFSKLKTIPLIITEHWSGYFKEDGNYKGWFLKFITKNVVKRASAILTVSDSLKKAMENANLKGNYYIVPNVVDTTLFYPSNESYSVEVNILHVSTVNDREKNISGMLRVIKKLSEVRNDFTLTIVGDSDEKIVFEQLATDLNILNTYVFFKGSLSPNLVAEEMRRSNFFLLFSNYENLPCVLIEAFASGIPVIATEVGGIPKMVNKDNGILVKSKDELQLYNALMDMITNYKSFNKEKIRKYAEENYSYEKVGKQISAIYKNILA